MKLKIYHLFSGCFSFQLNLFLIWLISQSNECEWWPRVKERTWERPFWQQPAVVSVEVDCGTTALEETPSFLVFSYMHRVM